MSGLFATIDSVPPVREFAKNVQKIKPLYAKIGYGSPSLGTFAKTENTRVKTTMMDRGCTIAQAMPNDVCL